MFSASLLATLCLVIQASATPVVQVNQPCVTLSFNKHFNLTSGHHLVHRGQARAAAFKLRGVASNRGSQPRAVIDLPADNEDVQYIADVEIGSEGVKFQLVLDTGSSNLWIPDNKYVKTSTSRKTADRVFVDYGLGAFMIGDEWEDSITIGNGSTIPKQSIGVATQTLGFNGIDGILGMGPARLTRGTLLPAFNKEIPTVTDNLFSNGLIPSNELGVSFAPSNRPEALNGELTWGGVDGNKFIGSITWIPLTQTKPANAFWGIDGAMRYGSSTSILSTTAGIVDSATTLVFIAADAFQRYKSATGAVVDFTTGLLRITNTQLGNMQSLFFTAQGSNFELTPNAQLWPRSLNTMIGGTASGIYLIIGELSATSGQGLDFILGKAFMERFYTVFDTSGDRVGLAKTEFTTATVN